MIRTQPTRSGERGVTLIEAMVVVVILGLLSAIAFPAYQAQMIKSRRADGQALLMDMAARMERYYFDNTTYTTDLTDVGYSAAKDVPSAEQFYVASVDSPTTNCPIISCYSITAQPVGIQAKDDYCGNLSLNSLGEKTISGSGEVDRCW